jgi:LCP family protein required for cell wall assembly
MPGHRRGRRAALAVAVALVLAGVGLGYGTWASAGRFDRNIRHVDGVFSGGHRPRALAPRAIDILVLGSDVRTTDPRAMTSGDDPSRSDTIMICHLDSAHRHGWVLSIPRDSYVPVPGHGHNKINSAYAYGGARLTRQTVEDLTGIRFDHYLEINFAGFTAVTDAVGGVDLTIDRTVYDPRSKRTFTAGAHHFDGAEALDYVRQRYNLRRGDFDREARQQQFLHALLARAADMSILGDPRRAGAVLDGVSRALTADSGFDLRDFAWDLRHLRPSDLTFVTVPVADAGVPKPGAGSVVELDKPGADQLFKAVATDTMVEWVRGHPRAVTDSTHGR